VSPERDAEKVRVDVEGRTLTLTNLEKVLYPEVGFTKAQVIDYYTRVAPALLPHLEHRALTMKRYPNGVDGHFFFEKNAPSHRPDWVRTARLPAPGSTKKRETIDYTVVDDLPTLVWAANLASLELHTHMWRVDQDDQPLTPDLMVVDLDPGPGTGIPECCQVAQLVREHTDADWCAKTSGSKGMQLYCAVRDGRTADETRSEMRQLAEKLEQQPDSIVVSRMTKSLRPGKVLVDWSQNNAAKTTISVYSLRARPRPTVSTPVSWEEVEAGAVGKDPLVFTADDVLSRVDELGDLFAPLLQSGTGAAKKPTRRR
jgi:bifunctional non-homologous end joining protein LigD